MYKSKLKGNLILLITAIIWGISFISQSTSMDFIGPATFTGIRTTLGAIVLCPFILFSGYKNKKMRLNTNNYSKKTLWFGGILCGLALCAASTIQTYSMVGISSGKAAFLTANYIIFVPIISIFLKKRPPLKIIPTIMLSMVGFYFLCMTSSDLTVGIFDFYALICAIIFSIHIMLIDYFAPKVEGIKLSCIQFFVCGILDIILMFLFEKPDIGLIIRCWLPIVYSGVFSCGIAYTLQIIGQKYTDPTSATLIMSLESVFAALFSWILPPYIAEDIMNGREIFGCLLIFAAIILIQLPPLKTLFKKNN